MAVNEDGSPSVQLAAHVVVRLGKHSQAVFDIAVSWRGVVRQGDATVAHSERLEVLRVAGSAIIHGQDRADSTGTQIRRDPGIEIGTGATRKHAGHQPENMIHDVELAITMPVAASLLSKYYTEKLTGPEESLS